MDRAKDEGVGRATRASHRAPAGLGHAAGIPDAAFALMDGWCRGRAARLTEKAGSHVMAGRSLDAPRYRMLLGEHRAYMAMRSFIHGVHAAQGTEAGTAETQGGSVHDGPVAESDAPKGDAQ